MNKLVLKSIDQVEPNRIALNVEDTVTKEMGSIFVDKPDFFHKYAHSYVMPPKSGEIEIQTEKADDSVSDG